MEFTAETHTWSMSKAELKALLLFASKDVGRINLNVVGFCPEEGGIHATDGNIALVVYPDKWRPGCEKSLPLSFAVLSSIAAGASARDVIELAFTRGGARGWTVTATWGAMRLEIEPLDVTTPPFRSIYPASMPREGSRLILNAAVLARVDAIARASRVNSLDPVQFYPAATELDAAMFVHQGASSVWSVLFVPLKGSFTLDAGEMEATMRTNDPMYLTDSPEALR